MRRLFIVLVSACGLWATASAAEGTVSEPAASLYLRFSFDGDSKHADTYGFRLDHVESSRNSFIDMSRLIQKPALADVQFSGNGMDAIKLKGRDMFRNPMNFAPEDDESGQ